MQTFKAGSHNDAKPYVVSVQCIVNTITHLGLSDIGIIISQLILAKLSQ